ncbi:hypothetical protein LCGC14_1577570 [marine sediment metagenome]|uniref:Recombination endonuclease VII n=1 Tax=marine sediment metagenome TaxID=412755 RepID=A0A0F9KYR8_9ZZZZ
MNEKAKESRRKASRKHNKTKAGKETLKKALQKYRSTDKYLNTKLQRAYGITLVQWQEMFEKQKGRCKICGKHQSELKKTLSVDHCHSTGEVRALLCHQCNIALGFVNEDSDIVLRLLEYIDEYC